MCSKDRGEGGSVVRAGSMVGCSKGSGEVQQRLW